MNSALAGRQGELQSHDCQKGTEEIAGEDPSILPCFLAAISSVPLPAATLQSFWRAGKAACTAKRRPSPSQHFWQHWARIGHKRRKPRNHN